MVVLLSFASVLLLFFLPVTVGVWTCDVMRRKTLMQGLCVWVINGLKSRVAGHPFAFGGQVEYDRLSTTAFLTVHR